jgi:transposase-like protein
MTPKEAFMVKRSKVETEQFYRDLIAEQARSGVSTRAFAAQRGIPSGTLSSWRHQLKKRDGAKVKSREVAPSFVPVRVVPRESATSIAAPRTEGYEIVVGVVRLPADFDEARVAALVRAVTSC